MDTGEHPASLRGQVFAFTNADSLRLYRNERLIREYSPKDSPFSHLPHPPIELDDFLGDIVEINEGFTPTQARYVTDVINYAARFGYNRLSPAVRRKALWLMIRYGMHMEDAYALYGKYTNNWGDTAVNYRFAAVKDGQVVASVTKSPVERIHLEAEASSLTLTDGATYDAALIRISMRDQNGNVLPFCQTALRLAAEGPIRIIGPELTTLRGGLGGTFVRTVVESGTATLTISAEGTEPLQLRFSVTVRSEENGGQ